MDQTKYKDIDDYIATFPNDTRILLEKIRSVIMKNAPGSKEVISYNMPAFRLNGNLVYFAGYKNHIGFYPTSSGIKVFEKKLTGLRHSKGAIQFPLDRDLPVKLISEIVKFRVQENIEKIKLKNLKK